MIQVTVVDLPRRGEVTSTLITNRINWKMLKPSLASYYWGQSAGKWTLNARPWPLPKSTCMSITYT